MEYHWAFIKPFLKTKVFSFQLTFINNRFNCENIWLNKKRKEKSLVGHGTWTQNVHMASRCDII